MESGWQTASEAHDDAEGPDHRLAGGALRPLPSAARQSSVRLRGRRRRLRGRRAQPPTTRQSGRVTRRLPGLPAPQRRAAKKGFVPFACVLVHERLLVRVAPVRSIALGPRHPAPLARVFVVEVRVKIGPRGPRHAGQSAPSTYAVRQLRVKRTRAIQAGPRSVLYPVLTWRYMIRSAMVVA
jgi:hypothetical protein